MFSTTRTRELGAPEILDGTQQSAPRSWNNLRSWSTRKDPSRTVHREHERLGTASTLATPVSIYPVHQDASKSSTQRRQVAITSAFKHFAVFLAFCIPIIFLALVINVPKWYAFEADYWMSNAFTHCNFNGKFTSADKPTLSLWDPAGFFYITVSWGKMAFSTAKCIDIVWDIIVGRGGQAFLAVITFKVSSQYLAVAMREAPVSYNTFESLAFVPPGVIRTARLAGDLLTNRGWKARLIIVWIIFSSLFVLIFSSLITAMSGYSSNINAVMNNHDGDTVNWSNFATVHFTFNDAERIGHNGPLFITSGDTCVQQGFLDDDDKDGGGGYSHKMARSAHHRRDTDDEDTSGEISWQYVPTNCTTFWRTVQYVHEFGLDGLKDEASNININGTTHNLAAPVLDITTSYSPVSLATLNTYLTTLDIPSPPGRGSLSPLPQIPENTFWLYDNEIYSFSYVQANARCEYSSLHNWGFSFLFLFVTALLLAIWSVGTYALWLYTHLHSPEERMPSQEGTGGIYRSSWTLVEAMRRDVGNGAVTPEMNESEIRGLVRRRRGTVLNGVGNIDRTTPHFSYSEKPSTFDSPSHHQPSTNPVSALRNWISPSSRLPRHHHHPRHNHHNAPNIANTPANSVFTHATNTFSSTSTSHRPILSSPALPGRTMTMTSRLSSLASPFADSPLEFGFSAAQEEDLLGSPTTAEVPGTPATKTRPKLSLSRAIRSSTQGDSTARAGSVLSPTSAATAKWVHTPSPLTPSEDGGSMISPVKDGDRGREKERDREGDAVRWRNDLGDG